MVNIIRLNPIMLGLIAGITVYVGAVASLLFMKHSSRRLTGFINGIAGGILGYLAYEATRSAEDALTPLLKFETLNEFLMGLIATSIALLGTWQLLASIEVKLKKDAKMRDFASSSKINSIIAAAIISVALGVHNLGEGFAISSSLIEVKLSLAFLFTAGFSIHNATEGFAIMAPIMRAQVGRGNLLKIIVILPALAGLPTILGTAIYYVGGLGGIWISFLNTVAAASIIYAMIKVNLSAASDLGGFNRAFWMALFVGTSFTYVLESFLVLSFM